MAASSGIAALRGPLAPPVAESTTPATSDKPRKQILDEVDSIKREIESAVKTLEKIDTGRRKAEANRAEAGKGRVQVDELKKRIASLGEEVKEMQQPPPGDELYPTFFRRKTDATKTLTDLAKKLEKVDKHLKRAADTIPTTAASVADAHSAAVPIAATTAPAEEQNNKGVTSLLGWSLFGSKKKSASRESLASTTPAAPPAANPPKEKGQETRETADDQGTDSDAEDSDEEEDKSDRENSDDNDDVVSGKKD